jgi:hypothetical protein
VQGVGTTWWALIEGIRILGLALRPSFKRYFDHFPLNMNSHRQAIAEAGSNLSLIRKNPAKARTVRANSNT